MEDGAPIKQEHEETKDKLKQLWEKRAEQARHRRKERCQEGDRDGGARIEGQTIFSDVDVARGSNHEVNEAKKGQRFNPKEKLIGSINSSIWVPTLPEPNDDLSLESSLPPLSQRNRRASSEPLATRRPLDTAPRRHSLAIIPETRKLSPVHPTSWHSDGEFAFPNAHDLCVWFEDLIKEDLLCGQRRGTKSRPAPLQIVFDWIIAITSLFVIIGLLTTWGISQLSPLTSLVVSSLITSSGLCRISYAKKIDLFEVCPVAQPVAILANNTPHSEQPIQDLVKVFDDWKDVIETANSHLALPYGLRKSKAEYAVLARQLRYSSIPLPGGDELISALCHLSESISHQADSLIDFNFALLSAFNTLAAVTEHMKRQLSIVKDGHVASLTSTGFWLFSRSTLEADMVILRREYLAHCTIVWTHLGALLDAADKVLSLLKQGHIDLSAVNQKVFWINQQLGSDSSSSAKSVSASPYRLWWSRLWLWNNLPRQLQDSKVLNVSNAVRLSEQAHGYLELVRAFVFDRRKAWESFKEHLRTISCVEGGDMALEVHLNILSSQMQWYTIIADEARSRTLEHATVHIKDSRKPDNAD